MCHQHVEPGRAERASERNPATFEGSCGSAHVLPGSVGAPWRSPGPGAGLERPRILGRARTELQEHRGARAGLRQPCGSKQLGSRGAAVRSRLAGLGTGNRAARSWASRARRAGAGKFLGVQPSRTGGYEAGGARLPRPQHCLLGRVRCASYNPAKAGFGARRPRSGGAGGFLRNVRRASAVPRTGGGTQSGAAHLGSTALGTRNSKADGS